MLGRVEAGRFDDLDAAVDDHLAVLVVREGVDRRQDGEVDTERLVGQLPGPGYLRGEILRSRLGECSEYP